MRVYFALAKGPSNAAGDPACGVARSEHWRTEIGRTVRADAKGRWCGFPERQQTDRFSTPPDVGGELNLLRGGGTGPNS